MYCMINISSIEEVFQDALYILRKQEFQLLYFELLKFKAAELGVDFDLKMD
jgi:hypothetical protein